MRANPCVPVASHLSQRCRRDDSKLAGRSFSAVSSWSALGTVVRWAPSSEPCASRCPKRQPLLAIHEDPCVTGAPRVERAQRSDRGWGTTDMQRRSTQAVQAPQGEQNGEPGRRPDAPASRAKSPPAGQSIPATKSSPHVRLPQLRRRRLLQVWASTARRRGLKRALDWREAHHFVAGRHAAASMPRQPRSSGTQAAWVPSLVSGRWS